MAEAVAGSPSRYLRAACQACPTSRHRPTAAAVPSFCSIGTILPSRPARATSRRAQRQSRMARLRATAPAARSVLDGREHDGIIDRVGVPISLPNKQAIKSRPQKAIKKRADAYNPRSATPRKVCTAIAWTVASVFCVRWFSSLSRNRRRSFS